MALSEQVLLFNKNLVLRMLVFLKITGKKDCNLTAVSKLNRSSKATRTTRLKKKEDKESEPTSKSQRYTKLVTYQNKVRRRGEP